VTADLLAAGVLARTGAGRFTVEVGPRRRDRLVARLAGLRRTGTVPVTIAVTPLAGRPGQRWARTLDGRRVTTVVAWRDGALVERLGPLEMTFATTASPGGTGAVLRLRRAALAAGPARVPLPRRWTPNVTCTTEDGPAGLDVRVEVGSRRGRRLLAYGGTIT
jgi:hypothetical protein